MKAKGTFSKIFFSYALVALLISGCEKAGSNLMDGLKPSDQTVNTVASKTTGAGTNYEFPNGFNTGGLLCSIGGTYNTQEIGTPMELWMGVGNENAGTLVGHVTFLSGPDRVRIDLNDADGVIGPDFFPYVVTVAHIHFAPTVAEIPHTNIGNPIPGQFEYNVPVDPYQTVIEIPVEFDAVGAIHLSVVKFGGIEGFNFYLPNNQVTLRIVDYPSAGDPAYFRMKVTNGGFISGYDMGYGPGIYEAWCVDADHTIYLNQNYPAYMFSSYENLPSWVIGAGNIEYPENFDKINYLVNHFETGQLVQPMDADCTPLPIPAEPLTYSDIQKAIWSLIENDPSTNGLSSWSQYRVNAILCQVNSYGEGFVPDCSQKIVFIVVPTGTYGSYGVQIVVGQPVIGEIEVPCETMGGTAWGDGNFGAGFPGAKQWGTYFSTVCP